MQLDLGSLDLAMGLHEEDAWLKGVKVCVVPKLQDSISKCKTLGRKGSVWVPYNQPREPPPCRDFALGGRLGSACALCWQQPLCTRNSTKLPLLRASGRWAVTYPTSLWAVGPPASRGWTAGPQGLRRTWLQGTALSPAMWCCWLHVSMALAMLLRYVLKLFPFVAWMTFQMAGICCS